MEEEPRIEALCRNLDGMALGIELAAARMPSLGLDGLEAGLADRLQLLTGGRRNNQRHQSLRSTLDWSYALLHEPERTVLRRISVFAASFSPEAAEPNRSPNGLPQNSARCGRSSEPLPITAS